MVNMLIFWIICLVMHVFMHQKSSIVALNVEPVLLGDILHQPILKKFMESLNFSRMISRKFLYEVFENVLSLWADARLHNCLV